MPIRAKSLSRFGFEAISPGRTHTKETGFFTESADHNLCFFVKKPGFGAPVRKS
jgi:hypothetical protein